MRRARAAMLARILPLVFLSACPGKTPTGGLEVIITTSGLQVGTDFDAIEGVVKQETSPGVWHQLFDVAQYVPQPITLPTTLAIRPGTSPDQDALVTVTALLKGAPVVQRVVQTQIPTDRVAELLVVLAADCLGKVGLCPAGQSCQPSTGMCGTNYVDPNTLPPYPSPWDAGTLPEAGAGEMPDATLTQGGDATLADGAEGSSDAGDATGNEATADAANIVAPIADANGDSSEAGRSSSGPMPSAGCGKAWTGPTGMWTPQPTGCPSPNPASNGGYLLSGSNQGTAACQTIPPGSTVPATATSGSPEYRGWWVYVPNGYDPTKPYTVIYNGAGCEDYNWFHAGADGFPYHNVDNGQAILVGLDYDTHSRFPGCYDTGDPKSNDLAFMPWLMNEIESTLCVDTAREWMSEYNNAEPSLAQQFDCAFPAKLRGQVLVGGSEPGAASYLGALPPCNPAPTAAFFVRDVNDKDNPYANILPGCSRVLRQNGCSNTTCNPLDETLTTPYPVPAGVTLPTGATCVQFKGCPAEYPVAFCVTDNQGTNDGQQWGVVTLFWDFINGLPGASPLCPPGQGYQSGACAPCPVGETLCGVVCVNEQTDSNNCGGCGVECPLGVSCQNGACACPSGDTACGSACVNEQTDSNNCGTCGVGCPAGASCLNGACACPTGDSVCEGACVDEQTDPNNCGSCGATCATNTCSDGACIGSTTGSASSSCVAGGPGMTDCGASSESCCTSSEVPRGTYYRTYTNDGTGPTGETDPATVSGFQLDKYLVTVGRFRQFVSAVFPTDGSAPWSPSPGSGKHTHLNNGSGLTATGGGYESGWVATDDGNIAPTDTNLRSCSQSTWTTSAGSQENLAVNCVNWWEAYAFCIWDGGFLPSEAEWEYAAVGGNQQREYPWGSDPPGTANQYAIYDCNYPSGSASCPGAQNIAPVGYATLGAGLWGQLDLAGEVLEWNIDWSTGGATGDGTYTDPCTDCANLTATSVRVCRGGDSDNHLPTPQARNYALPAARSFSIGLRCARAP